ncbi:MAG TPA: cellulase family glycosylhydrolase [Acidimicrobiales bacterium]
MKLGQKVAAFGVCVALIIGAAGFGGSTEGPAAPRHDERPELGPVAPLSNDGRWFTDATGRVVLLHGVNEVFKSAPYYPAADAFGPDDAKFLAGKGFNTVRLGINFLGLMPEPGQIDYQYIENIATSVRDLARRRIFVLLDFHQDGFAPKYNGNGLPDWMGIDDGLPNPPDAVFPLYYVQNPAMQRAFESFWSNRAGPDGIGIQDHYIDGLRAVAERFADDPYVMGYELMNEPWPGATWQPCVFGPAEECAALEQERLVPFHQKATAAVREITQTQGVYVEPFVLFNFGMVGTTLPGADSDDILSFHSYAVDVGGEQGVVDNAVAAAERDDRPLIETEFGATMDVPTLQRLTGQVDDALVSWQFWAYREELVSERELPASLATVRDVAVLQALNTPYPAATTGTPTSAHFDPATRIYDLAYDTVGPSGQTYPRTLDTVVSIPNLQYRHGYTVEVTGAKVSSAPCSTRLTLRNRAGAAQVTVRITPGGRCR